MRLCVRACVRACAYARACVRVRARARARAVSAEHFGAAAGREKERAQAQRAMEAGHSAPHFCTDPLMASLAHFDTNADLAKRIRTLFEVRVAVAVAVTVTVTVAVTVAVMDAPNRS